MDNFYANLTDEERKRAARENIPMFELTGETIELTDKERERARKMITILAKVSSKAKKEHKRYDLSKITPDTKIEDVEFFD